MEEWLAAETSTHQDHVVAHVIDTALLGYFVVDEALHLLLNIGFVWTIYLDCQMVLLPQSVALAELAMDADQKEQLSRDIELVEAGDGELTVLKPIECTIRDVNYFSRGDERRLVLVSETSSLIIETSLASGRIEVRMEG
jgi:hypothetical protein